MMNEYNLNQLQVVDELKIEIMQQSIEQVDVQWTKISKFYYYSKDC